MHKLNQEPKDENGLPHGEWIGYHRNGQLDYRYNYVHGIRHGLDESYFSDGTLWYRLNWNMGYYHGISEAYSNGELDRFSFDHMDNNLLFVTPRIKELSLCL